MINSIIVQSNILCLLQSSCNVDKQLVFVQNRERQSDIATRERVVDSPKTGMHGVWRDWCLDGFPPRYI